MLELPRSTEFNKRIPKQRFYVNLQITPSLKKYFIEQIHSIIWMNKIAPSTINLAAGRMVMELQVFLIRLNDGKLNETVLRQIDREIPYHILFLLEYEGKIQAWIGYKEEAGSGTATFKVNQYYHSEWVLPENLLLKIEGLDLDSVYENLVRQIAGERLGYSDNESLKDTFERVQKREKIMKQIVTLERKMHKEKQFSRQVQLNSMIKRLRKEVEELK